MLLLLQQHALLPAPQNCTAFNVKVYSTRLSTTLCQWKTPFQRTDSGVTDKQHAHIQGLCRQTQRHWWCTGPAPSCEWHPIAPTATSGISGCRSVEFTLLLPPAPSNLTVASAFCKCVPIPPRPLLARTPAYTHEVKDKQRQSMQRLSFDCMSSGTAGSMRSVTAQLRCTELT